MHYYLRFPQTNQATLMEILPPNPQNSLYTFISSLMGLREDMRIKLKTFNYEENTTNISNVIQSIEAYLYKLNGFIEYYNKKMPEDFGPVPEFEWRSAIIQLSSGNRIIEHLTKKGVSKLSHFKSNHLNSKNSEKNSNFSGAGSLEGRRSEFVGGFQSKASFRSLEYEFAFTLTALGIGRSIMAYSRIRSMDNEIMNEKDNGKDTSSSRDSEGLKSILGQAGVMTKEEQEQEQRQINISGKDFATAAGIFQYVRDNLLSNLANIAPSVLDLTSDIQYMLESLALADATRLSVNRGVRTGTIKPMVLARLLLHVYEQYKQAFHILNSLPRNESKYVVDDIRRYIKDGQQVVYAQALIYLSKAYSDENKYGLAVGFIKESQSLLRQTVDKDRSVHQHTAKMLLKNVVDDQLAQYEQNNNFIGLEKVPSSSELQSFVPAGRAFVQPVSYEPAKAQLVLP
ncbi:hypothetical protein H4219_003096 [Mycoemilia scoparia]|uniref:pH-response regulator protein palC n=1 Tax=Mycoemilia scoparia TaxID=417184 RepID=A0A9W8A3T2_9FUNG|nr:hypothetical protein H4219_003096 [Mycoemilia scoparia]